MRGFLAGAAALLFASGGEAQELSAAERRAWVDVFSAGAEAAYRFGVCEVYLGEADANRTMTAMLGGDEWPKEARALFARSYAEGRAKRVSLNWSAATCADKLEEVHKEFSGALDRLPN